MTSPRLTRFTDIVDEPLEMLMPIEGYQEKPLVSIEEAIQPLISIVNDIQRKTYCAREKCEKPPADGLTVDQSSSIILYTMEWTTGCQSLYHVLNQTLRSEERERLKPWFLYLKLFLTALARLPSMHLTVYRGVKSDLSGVYRKKKEHIWWGFSSCTKSLEVLQSEKFLGKTGSRTLFAIECQSGKDIQRHSYFKKESEILLPAARQFQKVSILDSGNELSIVQLKEIEPPYPLLDPIPIPTTNVTRSPLQRLIDQCQPSAHLHLWLRDLTDEDMPVVLEEGIQNKQCVELSLWGNEITSSGAAVLARGLINNSSLIELYLSHNCLSNIGVQLLAQVLTNQNQTLKILDLSSNGITDLGAQHLTEMLKANRTLTNLSLSQNKISDRGVQLFAFTLASFNDTLEELNLSSNIFVQSVTIDALLSMFFDNQRLKKLYLRCCQLSQDDSERLQEISHAKENFFLFL